MAGPRRLRIIKVKILADTDTHVRSGNACAGEIILAGLNVKDFLADSIGRLSEIDYGDLDAEEETAKAGKLGYTLLSQRIDAKNNEIQTASKWACVPLIVPKPGKEGFRFTVDLRPVNVKLRKLSCLCLTPIQC